MALRRRADAPPPLMTWPKATPFLVTAAIFDAARVFFVFFWFLGPAVAASLCASGVNSSVGTSIAETGGQAVAVACSFGAGVGAFYLGPGLVALGTVLAMASGFLGCMLLGFGLLMFNTRIFKENVMAFVYMLVALLVTQTPFMSALPVITVGTWRLHNTQIKHDKKKTLEWSRANADRLQRERREREERIAELEELEFERELDEEEALEYENVLVEEARAKRLERTARQAEIHEKSERANQA